MSEPLTKGRLWGTADRSGGPLDAVLGGARRLLPGLTVERLQVTHPGDDDNVYFLSIDSSCVQVDSGPHGRAPFIVEGVTRTETSDPAEAFAAVCAEFGLH
ncbi:hypothetical protein ACFC1T_34700 [Kitasatospora sp. NPDC056076]|uniref:hypothetical protein n=1 Tax=Kitasatospora sp. NPDC056076 TaxID=3345703 RepID=UPI0035DE3483